MAKAAKMAASAKAGEVVISGNINKWLGGEKSRRHEAAYQSAASKSSACGENGENRRKMKIENENRQPKMKKYNISKANQRLMKYHGNNDNIERK